MMKMRCPQDTWICSSLELTSPCRPPPPAGLRKVMVRAHRQAWCWQDEWYGLTIEDIRQLELETQLALAKKMAQYSEGGAENSGSSASQDQGPGAEAPGSAAEADGGGGKLGDSLETRGELTKQWSTSSRSSNRSSKRGGEDQTRGADVWKCACAHRRITWCTLLRRESVSPEHLGVEDAEHRPRLRGQHGRRVLRRAR